MIDKTLREQEALETALQPLEEISREIGLHKRFSDYTQEEALILIEVVVGAYQTYLLSLEDASSPEISEKGTCFHDSHI